MTQDPPATIRSLGANRDYSDGAEERVLAALDKVTDRTDGSDELFRQSVDWPTTYHFSPRRSNVLRPFEIGESDRVLEIGAGTGAITRYLGERGAEVIALEGESIRAQAIAHRCSDLPNVQVVSGSLRDFRDPSGFDLVVVIGVLEYAGPASPDSRDQIEFLRHASDLIRPGGALILAIENQIGLKYLLGYSEDHLNEAWAGVEGYPGRPAVCTLPRIKLGSILEECGLPTQRWYYPYPDYKLPKTILAEKAFDLPTAKDFVDQLVGRPVQDLANPPTRFCDDRACHRVFLEAGLGREVANSFLVVATRRNTTLDRFTDDTAIAWHYSSDRLKWLRRCQRVRRRDGELRLTAALTYPDAPTDGTTWIEHDPKKDETYLIGRTLEQQALEFSRNRDLGGLTGVLQRWSEILTERESAPQPNSDEDSPFAPRSGRAGLPPEYLDSSLSNFVDIGDAVVFVDREWLVGSQIDGTLTRFRVLWYFALELVISGIAHPFSPEASVNDLAFQLADLAGLDLNRGLVEEFMTDEARIQEVVTGIPAQRVRANLRDLGSTSRSKKEIAINLPIAQVRRDLAQLGEHLEEYNSHRRELEREYQRLETWAKDLEARCLVAEKRVQELTHEAERREQELTLEVATVAELQNHVATLKTEATERARVAADLEDERDMLKSWRDAFEQRRPVRLLRRFQSIVGSRH